MEEALDDLPRNHFTRFRSEKIHPDRATDGAVVTFFSGLERIGGIALRYAEYKYRVVRVHVRVHCERGVKEANRKEGRRWGTRPMRVYIMIIMIYK